MAVSVPVTSAPAGARRLLFPESWPAAAQAGAIMAVATLAVYAGELSAPFVAGDRGRIFGDAMAASPWTAENAGWPLSHWSLAGQRMLGAVDVRGYHAINLLLHVVAGVLLFGVLRRTFGRFRQGAGFLAAIFGALLWAVHPLLTEAVTHISHRGELLGGGLFFLTLLAAIHAMEERAANGWKWLAAMACALGMVAGPVLVAAPVIGFLYDRAFVAGSFRAAWRRNQSLHLLLAATWLVLLFAAPRGLPTVDAILAYGRGAVALLKLSVWPNPLVFDYGTAVATGSTAWAPWLLPGVVVIASLVTVVRWPRVGVAVAGVVLPLALPAFFTRSGTEWISEHRMYVPLAALAGLLAASVSQIGNRRWAWILAVPMVGLALVAHRRTADYHSELNLWTDTVAKAPGNPRARFELANALAAAGRPGDAVREYETVLQLAPDLVAARQNLAGALLHLGRGDQAVSHYEVVLRAQPGRADARLNLAAALVRLGRMEEAVAHYEAATKLGVVAADQHRQFGRALAEVGRLDDALEELAQAVRLEPQDAETRVVLGMVLSAAGRPAEGMKHFLEAVRLNPNDAAAHSALGDALVDEMRPAEALPHFEAALRLEPARAATLHVSLGHALFRLGRAGEAIDHYEAALRLNPDDTEARANLDLVRAALRRRGDKK